LWLLGTVMLATHASTASFIDTGYGAAWLALVLTMWFAPKIATVIDVLCRPTLRRGFGGSLRFAASVVVETIFWLLLSPIMWVCHTLFFLGLPIGRAVGWGVQGRDDHSIGWTTALAKLWPQMLLGVAGLAVVVLTHPAALPYVFFLVAGGPALAVPLCVVTSWPSVGLALQRIGIGRLPEETEPPAALSRRAALAAAD
jgi:membrane glycosyltransferase